MRTVPIMMSNDFALEALKLDYLWRKDVLYNLLVIFYLQKTGDEKQRRPFISALTRMGTALKHFFHSNINTCSSSIVQSCSSKWPLLQTIITQPISRSVDMIIALSLTPLPSFNISIPIHVFLPSTLRSVVDYLRFFNSNVSEENDLFRYLLDIIPRAAGFISNSWEEIDANYVDEFHELSKNYAPIRFVGPIIFDDAEFLESKVGIEINDLPFG
jgi:hypothetical protein